MCDDNALTVVESTPNQAISGWSAGNNKGDSRDLVDLRVCFGLRRSAERSWSRKERWIRQIPQKVGNSAVSTEPHPTEGDGLLY